MKIYGIVENQILKIASTSPIEGAEEIEISEKEWANFQNQWDTFVENGKVVSQKKGENAELYEEFLENQKPVEVEEVEEVEEEKEITAEEVESILEEKKRELKLKLVNGTITDEEKEMLKLLAI